MTAKRLGSESRLLHPKDSFQIAENQADVYIAAGTPIEQVRADLFTKMAGSQSVEVASSHQPNPGTSGQKATVLPSASEIYAKRAAARAERRIN